MADLAEFWQNLIRQKTFHPGKLLLKVVLRMISWGYAVAVFWRNRQFDRQKRAIHRVNARIISVGNLTLGGTGKTPCVEAIARLFQSENWQVALLSRGYGQSTGRNDEAKVLEENLPDVPHLQGANRVELAQTAVEELLADVLILDDGFQHRRLHRDFDLVLVDATDPWGPGYLFPRGTLRENKRSLQRASAVLITRVEQATETSVANLKKEISQYTDKSIYCIKSQAQAILQEGKPPQNVELLTQKRIAVFCGIGNPQAFLRNLQLLGAEVVAHKRFADHHPYQREDIEALAQWADSMNVDAIVTTQKDSVKIQLATLGNKPLWTLQIGIELPEPLQNELLAVMDDFERPDFDEEYPEAFLPQE